MGDCPWSCGTSRHSCPSSSTAPFPRRLSAWDIPDVYKRQPLGDPVEITVRGYELSIRKEEAAIVEVA